MHHSGLPGCGIAVLVLSLTTVLSGCATTEAGGARSDARAAYIQCLSDYVFAARLVEHEATLEESGLTDFCGAEEIAYRARIVRLASGVSVAGREETADLVIRQTWEEITR